MLSCHRNAIRICIYVYYTRKASLLNLAMATVYMCCRIHIQHLLSACWYMLIRKTILNQTHLTLRRCVYGVYTFFFCKPATKKIEWRH